MIPLILISLDSWELGGVESFLDVEFWSVERTRWRFPGGSPLRLAMLARRLSDVLEPDVGVLGGVLVGVSGNSFAWVLLVK